MWVKWKGMESQVVVKMFLRMKYISHIDLNSKFSGGECQMSRTNWYNFQNSGTQRRTKCKACIQNVWAENCWWKKNSILNVWPNWIYSSVLYVGNRQFAPHYWHQRTAIMAGEATIILNKLSHLIGGSWVDYPTVKNPPKYTLYTLQVPEQGTLREMHP